VFLRLRSDVERKNGRLGVRLASVWAVAGGRRGRVRGGRGGSRIRSKGRRGWTGRRLLLVRMLATSFVRWFLVRMLLESSAEGGRPASGV
jgi:hypothetical protein